MKSGHETLAVISVLIIVVLVITGMIYLLSYNKSKQPIIAIGTQTPQVQTQSESKTFSDGLVNPRQTQTFKLNDFGEGTAEQNVFLVDINQDGVNDRITRTRQENGTSHYWDEYTLELNIDGRLHNITPPGKLRTTMGTECALSRTQFIFQPKFQIIKISRPWVDSWNTPSVATQTKYEIQNNKLVITGEKQLRSVCDVSELFM